MHGTSGAHLLVGLTYSPIRIDYPNNSPDSCHFQFFYTNLNGLGRWIKCPCFHFHIKPLNLSATEKGFKDDLMSLKLYPEVGPIQIFLFLIVPLVGGAIGGPHSKVRTGA